MGSGTHSRDVDDRRRSAELDKFSKTKKFGSVPSLGQLADGQVVVIEGQNMIAWRDGNKIYTVTGTEI